VWLRPDTLARLGLTPSDVISAIKEQNLQAPAGRVGQAPTPADQAVQFTVSAPGRLVTSEEFENIIIRESQTGTPVRIRDVGRADLGSQDYNSFGRLIGKSSGAVAGYLLPGANQLQAAETIYKTMATAKTLFPPDLDYTIVYDTTPAVQASIHEIVKTFVEALILVTIVVFIFLQNIRATIIPLLTVPVSIVGTFIFFPLLGFSVNTLSMFCLMLAIGIVVDDAIVVVEAVMHHIEHGMSPRDATSQAMKEVSAPVIGIALILSAVFIPVAFIGGLIGRMYTQFALTIAISVLLSAFSALSLSPALAAMLLRPARPMRGPLGVFFRGFDWVFEVTTRGYVSVAGLLVRHAVFTVLLVGIVVVGVVMLGGVLSKGFIPEEDQGLLGINVQLPPAASLERTSAVLRKVEAILAKTEGIESYQTIGGSRARPPPHAPGPPAQPAVRRLRPRHPPLPAELRQHLRPSQAVGRAARRSAAREGDHGPREPRARADPGGYRLHVQHPDHLRLRRLGGLQLPLARPERRAERGRAQRADAWRPGRPRLAARAARC